MRPLIRLLHPEKSAIENYEALMALTNLAGVDDSVRFVITIQNFLTNKNEVFVLCDFKN